MWSTGKSVAPAINDCYNVDTIHILFHMLISTLLHLLYPKLLNNLFHHCCCLKLILYII